LAGQPPIAEVTVRSKQGVIFMKRVGFLLKVKQERMAEYIAHHEHVWPEMLQALSASGWTNYSLFIREDGLLFGYFETDESLAVAQERMAARDINTRWQEFMAPYFESPTNSRPDEMFLELDEIFHLD
jgi:L-rhamnose mutarotase